MTRTATELCGLDLMRRNIPFLIANDARNVTPSSFYGPPQHWRQFWMFFRMATGAKYFYVGGVYPQLRMICVALFVVAVQLLSRAAALAFAYFSHTSLDRFLIRMRSFGRAPLPIVVVAARGHYHTAAIRRPDATYTALIGAKPHRSAVTLTATKFRFAVRANVHSPCRRTDMPYFLGTLAGARMGSVSNVGLRAIKRLAAMADERRHAPPKHVPALCSSLNGGAIG